MRGLVAILFLVSPVWARVAEERNFDLGLPDSPLSTGFTRVTVEDVYTVDLGYGFYKCKPKQAFDDADKGLNEKAPEYKDFAHAFDDDALRDGVDADGALRFRANLYPSAYVVTIAVGRYGAPRHDMKILINDKPVVENVDAWGPVATTAGGPATRTIKTIAHTKGGRIIITVDFAKPKADRWKEYTDTEPTNGTLDFLGPNGVSILAVTFRPVRGVPIQATDGKLTTVLKDERILAVIDMLNTDRVDEAFALLTKIEERGLSTPKSLMLEECLRRQPLGDRSREIEVLAQCVASFAFALRFAPQSPTLRERLEQNRRYHRALELVSAAMKEGSQGPTQARRLWQAYDLAAAFVEEDPYFARTSVLCGQIADWAVRKEGWKHWKSLAETHFKAARDTDPDLKFPEELSP